MLGPLEVVDGGVRRAIPSDRQRVVLAVLLLQPGGVVSSERLIDALWGERPPASARATLRTHVAQLRKALGPGGAEVLLTEPPGYVLRLAPEQVDAIRFERLAREGHQLTATDPAAAAERLERALALWRGDPLGDIGAEPFARADAARLVEQRWAAVEDLAEARLALGQHGAVASELEAAVAEQPLRERLWEYLMVALYRSGRQAEALRAFQTARRMLTEELGVDPSPRLRQLEDRLLRQDPALDLETRPPVTPPSRPLPTGVVTFLLTDVEGSTRGWREHGRRIVEALRAVTAEITRAVEAHGGWLVKARGEGDSTFAVFERPADAVLAALDFQGTLARDEGRDGVALRVRAAIHTAEVDVEDGDYVGVEIARVARLRDAAHGGQVLVSAAASELLAEALPPDVSLLPLGAPRLKDFDRAQPVFQLVHPDIPGAFPPLRAPPAAPDLPAPLTAVVGRDRDVADVSMLLGEARLVTITGTGGCGKTRLALEVARRAAERFPDGVVMVELAPLGDPATVLPTVAAALGVRDASGRDLARQLRERTRPLNLLLVLDNCEHLLAASAELAAAILGAAPEVVVLATSRQRLGVPGESSYPLAPLAAPPAGESAPEAVSSWPAVELFVSRVGALDPAFRLTTENAASVAEICRRVDGLPLAIELAAVAVRALGMEAAIRAVERRLDAVAGVGELRPERHQTLRALIGWSDDLLTEPDRALFKRLSVMAGGFDLASAHAVCGDGDDGDETVAGIVRLVERSLVVPDRTGGGSRFRMLETIRAYAADMLGDDERARLRDRQLTWALSLTIETDAQLRREAGPGLARFELDLDNIRQAMDWGLSDGDPAMGVRLTTGLARFWAMRGRITEGRQWLERARTRLDDVPPAVAGWWYLATGALAGVAGEFHAARELLQRAIELQGTSGDPYVETESRFALAKLDRLSGDHAAAGRMYEAGLRLAETAGDAHNVAAGKAGLGDVACARGDYERGRELYEEALEGFARSGDQHAVGNAHLNLATANRGLARYDRAEWHSREALAVFRGLDDRSCTAGTLEDMAELAVAVGDGRQAAALYAEALALRAALEQRAPLAISVEGVGLGMASHGQWDSAVVLLAAAERLRAEGLARDPSAQRRYDEALAEARRVLGDEAFDHAWSTGRDAELATVVALAGRSVPLLNSVAGSGAAGGH